MFASGLHVVPVSVGLFQLAKFVILSNNLTTLGSQLIINKQSNSSASLLFLVAVFV